MIVSSNALEHYGQQLIEELTEEANVAADGSLFVQQLRRRRNESGGVPEEDDGPSSSALQAVLQTDTLLCLMGCPVTFEVWRHVCVHV